MDVATDQVIRATRFGRYEALLRIGRGGMAEVFAGRVRGEAGFQKLVAVKRMLPHLADDEKFAAMFLDEARLAANISSPHVVSTLDLGRSEDGALYLVMELIIGVTLSSLLRNAAKDGQQIPVGVAVEILSQAAQGLHDAHEARTPAGTPLGIVHRDVSPQNVLIGADGRSRITDFGVARAMLRRTDTTTGELKGKLAYFSPEQISDDTIDRRSDVFALGIVAWETFTGRRLFKAENPLALLDRIVNMPIPPVSKFNPEVPEDVDRVVQKALSRDRTQRYASTQDFANDLREAARKHLSLPDRAVLSAFVQRNAGERLKRLEESIRYALDETKSMPPPAHLSGYPDTGSGVMRTGASRSSNPGISSMPPGNVSGSQGSVRSNSTSRWQPPPTAAGKRMPSRRPDDPEDATAQASPAFARRTAQGLGSPSMPPSGKSSGGEPKMRASLSPSPGASRAGLPPDAVTKDVVLPFDDGTPLDDEDGPTSMLGEPIFDDHETITAGPNYNAEMLAESPYANTPSQITAEETLPDTGSDGVPTLMHQDTHAVSTLISDRESLGLPAKGANAAPTTPVVPGYAAPQVNVGPHPSGGFTPPWGGPPAAGGFPSSPGVQSSAGRFHTPPPSAAVTQSGLSAPGALRRTAIVAGIALALIFGVVLLYRAFSGPDGPTPEQIAASEAQKQAELQAQLEAQAREQEMAALKQQAAEAEARAKAAAEQAAADRAAAVEAEKKRLADEAAAKKAEERAAKTNRGGGRKKGPRQLEGGDTPTPVVKPPKKNTGTGITTEF